MAVQQLKQVPPEHRTAVLKMLMDKILGGQPESDDSHASAALVSRIAETLDPNERRRLAEVMSHSRYTPSTLINEFARDEVYVAEPILRWSQHINAEFLQEVAQDLSNAHLLVLSRRRNLSAEMAEIIIEHGDTNVRLSVALNPSAPLNKKIIIELMKSAAEHPEIEEGLCGRKDLPSEFFSTLMGRVRERLRAKVGSRAEALDPADMQLALRTVDLAKGAQDAPAHSLSMEAFVNISNLAKWGDLTEKHLIGSMSNRDVASVVACFGYLVGVDQHVSRGLISQSTGESLAVAARAGGMDRATFEALAGFRSELALTDTSASDQIEIYDTIPKETAQKVMAFHEARRSKTNVG